MEQSVIETHRSISRSATILRIGAITQFTYLTLTYGLGALLMFFTPPNPIWWPIAVETLILYGLLMLLVEYGVWKYAEHRIAGVISIIVNILSILEIYTRFIKENRGLMAFLNITILMMIFAVIMAICCLWGIVHLIIVSVNYHRESRQTIGNVEAPFKDRFRSTFRNWIIKVKGILKKHPKKHAIFMGCIIIFGILVIGLENYQWSLFGSVTIEPKSYQAKLTFWGKIDPTIYTASQKEAMNRSGILIVAYDTPDFTDYAEDRSWLINSCRYWEENYSSVQIMPVVLGMPGGFLWDGCVAGSINLTWTILNITIAESLTNVVGVNTDQETPQNLPDSEVYRNRTRNDAATAMWNQFFLEVEQKYPNRFEFQTTFSMSSPIDVFDGDTDLDIRERNNVLNVPGWDEFAPMLYSGDGPNYIPEVLDANFYHYELYQKMSLLEEGLKIKGLEQGIGVYIGITNMTIMGNSTRHRFNGVEGNGYDALVTQALIAKHFRCPRISIFMLDSTPYKGYMAGGVFESYGEDFIDRFNASINGPGADESFSIRVIPSWQDRENIILDTILEPESIVLTLFIAISFLRRKWPTSNAL
jgi:hypothetical protein